MKKRKMWFWMMTLSSIIYIGWRLIFTIPTHSGIVSLIAGICLFIAEFVSMSEAIIHHISMSRNADPDFPVIQPEQYPDVDVLISTHSEPVELLFNTINGCIHMDYPDSKKVHIFICDDGNREEMATLARKMNVGYFPLSENKYAKAGNLNNAIGKTNSPLIVTFDADMIPRSNFLMETVPYFLLPEMIEEDGIWRKRTEEEYDPDYKIGFVQTPQSFYNPDMFQYNFFAEQNIPNEQDYFFREVNVGRNSTNSVIYAGSNTMISRQALEEVGGIRTGTITEDFATGMDIQEHGYTCYGVRKVLASGLAPDTFSSLIKQRQRWGRGCVQVLRSFKFLFSKLKLLTKLSYISCLLYWWTFLRRLIYIMSPILYTVFDVLVVKTSWQGILFIWLPSYMIYNHSLRILSGKIRDQKWSNIVDTILCPYMIFPILFETFGLRMKKFHVTEKEKTTAKNVNMTYAIPHIILLIASCIGIYFSIEKMLFYKNFLGLVVLYWLCLNVYFLGMSVLFMAGRVNFRSSERFAARLPIECRVDDRIVRGYTQDVSENGFSFILDFPEYIKEISEFTITDTPWKANVKAQIVHVRKVNDQWRYSAKLEEIDFEERKNYNQIVYDRYPTLASEIKTKFVQDFFVFMKKKSQVTVPSNRKLPRIDLNHSYVSKECGLVKVIDYNYQYMSFSDSVQVPVLHLQFGDMELTLEKSDVSSSHNLYCVKNWKTLSSSMLIHKELKKILV